MSFYAHTCGFSWAFLYLRADHVGLVVSWVTGQRLSSNLGLVFFLSYRPLWWSSFTAVLSSLRSLFPFKLYVGTYCR